MTFGTALVISIGIICATFLATLGIGAWITVNKKK